MTRLQEAVDAFIKPTRLRLWREDTKKADWHAIPSLWDQLTTSTRWGSGEGGSSRFGSRPVISTGVVALIIEITAVTVEAAVDVVGKTRGNPPDNIRAIAANLTDAEQVFWWTEQLNRWTVEARNILRLDPPRPRNARGATCPACDADSAYTQSDGETIRTPALSIEWAGPTDQDYHPDSDWKVRAVQCRQCGVAWFRGGSMDSLIDMMLEANRKRETMTDDAAQPTKSPPSSHATGGDAL